MCVCVPVSLCVCVYIQGMVDIISNATEYDSLPVRPGEEEPLRKLILHSPLPITADNLLNPHVKANALLQAHFSRTQVAGDLAADSRTVVRESVRLLAAAVDVVASSGWLNPALVSMELSQMVTQGLWDKDSPLQQLPHVTKEIAAKCTQAGVGSVFDLIDMEDDARRELLGLSDPQLGDVAAVTNRYPDITLTYDLTTGDSAMAGETVRVCVCACVGVFCPCNGLVL